MGSLRPAEIEMHTETFSTIAVIPARGGSKRIPRKNIRSFFGTPLIARTIRILAASGLFDRIIVSTDDAEIAGIAKAAGAEVPFDRPSGLSGDNVPTAPVIEHALRVNGVRDGSSSFVCCVYPAAVLMTSDDLRAAQEILRGSDLDYVFSATSYAYPIQRALRRLPTGGCEMFQPEHINTLSQSLEHAFHDAGQFYWGRACAWLERRPVFGAKSEMFILPRYRVQDIDTEEDWAFAELLFQISQLPERPT